MLNELDNYNFTKCDCDKLGAGCIILEAHCTNDLMFIVEKWKCPRCEGIFYNKKETTEYQRNEIKRELENPTFIDSRKEGT